MADSADRTEPNGPGEFTVLHQKRISRTNFMVKGSFYMTIFTNAPTDSINGYKHEKHSERKWLTDWYSAGTQNATAMTERTRLILSCIHPQVLSSSVIGQFLNATHFCIHPRTTFSDRSIFSTFLYFPPPIVFDYTSTALFHFQTCLLSWFILIRRQSSDDLSQLLPDA